MKTEQEIIDLWESADVLVSICCTAYNHEKYIEQALSGFLEQETNFSFEIIVSDDCSTDNTTSIIRKYAKDYPNIIKPIYQEENQYSKGALPIRDFILPKVSGKYIALCEGDDYWNNPEKLQIQVDLLEENPTYMGCGHNTMFLEGGNITERLFLDPECTKKTYTFDDIVDYAYFHTTSLVYRYNDKYKKYIDEYLAKYSCVNRNDYYMLLVFSNFGPIGYINKVMSVYRLNDGGIWSGAGNEDQIQMFLKGCVDFSHIFPGYKSDFMISFANTFCEHINDVSLGFIDTFLSMLSVKDHELIIKSLIVFKKRDNDVIKECSEYITFLEKNLNDHSLKSLVIKIMNVTRVLPILRKIRGAIKKCKE
ncbi:glycosyltransferase family 2 protein [Francisella adeliensis]|uniref:Glycosyl transferase n=1 Tax=Francisella adeliensis TaxID=2007306 RepID=A0A2Z4XWZ3_9GAMM|nr:glycosyltransferase [Francisella adeliensis]AXA33401.1 glycosyl transferase [Francisella adeliensis]MBK2085417.1 glycosyltransferase [Francisella adeliensis]MBK2097147.1 glycosyltransferase [Francisella adeliensis]QIW11629.1 glycosyltransferase [Francisella adeliensis]QIW13504.1 glycosyltransferase [Francisella adeliensis]